eukprot:TRINITY_DN2606_c0_g2_i1.p1 TRINITY_DN2606_c0_g2~~TRINITY_DN2606_c0_g2_i1.p1  ORF type:complete len:107 (-),score=15.82 TRINITY_DN2606_c0_g2_i1:182-502(-)
MEHLGDKENIEFILQFEKDIFHTYTPRVFFSMFGVHPFTAGILYTVVRYQFPKLLPTHILWFLHWIRHYLEVDIACSLWKVSEKTYHSHILQIIATLTVYLDGIHN